MSLTAQQLKATEILWRRGDVAELKLHSAQLEMLEAFNKTPARKFVINCARRLGKSYFLCVMADQYARKKKGSQIKYAAPTAKAVRKIVKPIFKKLWEDCPKELKPKWNGVDQCYVYPNGSEVHIAGTDQGNAENLRGTDANLAIVDEAGFCDELDYLIQDILLPQTLTCNGRILIASTPPKTPGHEYVKIYLEAVARGAFIEKTIYANPNLTKETIEEYMDESGGETSTTWQREYLAKFVTDEETQIVPEFTEAKSLELVQVIERPDYYDPYVSMDVGFEDLTFVIFGYWDFAKSRLVIEDELVLQGGTEVRTDIVASLVKNLEVDQWGDKTPYLRVADNNNPILINDLNQLYGVNFMVTEKDEKEAQVNALRLLVSQNRLLIHPRCVGLIAHLRYGVWDKNRKKFARTKAYGHFDGVDSLVYLVRNLRKDKNPFPSLQHNPHSQFFINQPSRLSPNGQSLKDLFTRVVNSIGANRGK